MKASLLLLFVLIFHCSSASDDINWDDCGEGKTAFCRASNCKFTTPEGQMLLDLVLLKNERKCLGFHIKPHTTSMWTISMINQDQKEHPKEVRWAADSKEIFICKGNIASLGKDVDQKKLSLNNIAVSPKDYPFCNFTVVSQGGKISDILGPIHDKPEKTRLFSARDKSIKAAFLHMAYLEVDHRTPCSAKTLFKAKCEKEEDCVEPKPRDVINWECPAGYHVMYRNGSSFEEGIIKCLAGEFLVDDPSPGGPKEQAIPHNSVAKCVRKKCSVCGEKDGFMSIYQKPTNFGECASLKCKNETYMVMNITKGGQRATGNTVQCSVKTNGTEGARWVVEDEDDVEIESAECRQSVACEAITKITPSCEKTDERCKKPHLNSSGGYECKNGTMHVTLNETNVRIDPPKCETSGDWNVTMHLANSSSSILWKQENHFTIKCILAPVEKKAAPAESSFPWIVIVIAILLIFVVAVAIGIFFCLKRKNKKKSATPTPSKTSSSTSTSNNKPSSSEQEPLTSAMHSVTGTGSVKTAIPAEQKAPAVVLANADLRGITAAAASDPLSKDKKKEEKKGEPNADKREEKTSIGWPTEDTSKRQDSKDFTSKQETLAPMSKSAEELKSQTGGDGESQVTDKKTAESTKLLPKGAPRKYSKSGTKAAPKKKNDEFLNLTDPSDNDEQSKTGSKKKRNKKR